MGKWMFNRRFLLWAGLAAGSAIAGTKERLRVRAIKQQDLLSELRGSGLEGSGLEGSGLEDNTVSGHFNTMSAAYSSEEKWAEEVTNRKAILAFNEIVPPTVPYSRDMSRWMITFCKLAVQQYRTGREEASYDGNVGLLPTYAADILNEYRQIANFTIEEEIIEDYFDDYFSQRLTTSEGVMGSSMGDSMDGSMLEEELEAIELTLHDRIRRILQRKYRVAVYSGIAFASKDQNVLVFRGTQTQAEWLKNLNARQVPYVAPDGNTYGKVHEGFHDLMRQLRPSLKEVVAQLDPTLPCYVTGHSLGAAIATLIAMEISYLVPEMKENIRLYSYAGPRVGSPDFVRAHSQRIPNAYRVINLGDAVPLLPPVTMADSYVHVGEEWSFLVQSGDALLNHVVDTYREAMDRRLETAATDTQVNRLKIV